MSPSPSLDQVLRLAQELSVADQLRLIARLAPQLTSALEQSASTPPSPRPVPGRYTPTSGSSRSRWPVSAKTAFATAAPIGPIGGSPTP